MAPLKPHRILIVEDNLDTVHSFALLLRDAGHEVEYAINGYVALDVARRFLPDFIFLDLGLPGISGFEVCEQVRRTPELANARLIAMTGYHQEEYRERSKAAGFEQHLVKPVDLQTVLSIVGDARAPAQRSLRSV